MNANLQAAIDNLEIRDVYLRELNAICSEEIDPKYSSDLEDSTPQHMHIVRRSVQSEMDNGSSLLSVYIRMGMRWVESSESETEDESGSESDESNILALVEAEFVAEYEMKSDLTKECIEEFCLKNSSYHVWPYWRELLSSQCIRMHLPNVVMPTMQLAHNRHHGTEPE